MILDKQLDSFILTQANSISRVTEVSQIRKTLISWRSKAIKLDQNLPADETDRKIISQLVEQAITEGSGQELLDAFPASEAPLQDYMTWINSILPLIDEQLKIYQKQITTLEGKKNEISRIYADSSQKSLGLSPNLQVDKITTAQPVHTIERPIGLLVLIGGVLGLILWAIIWLTRISLQARK